LTERSQRSEKEKLVGESPDERGGQTIRVLTIRGQGKKTFTFLVTINILRNAIGGKIDSYRYRHQGPVKNRLIPKGDGKSFHLKDFKKPLGGAEHALKMVSNVTTVKGEG